MLHQLDLMQQFMLLAYLSVAPGGKVTGQLVDISFICHVCPSTPAPTRHVGGHETQRYWWSTSTS